MSVDEFKFLNTINSAAEELLKIEESTNVDIASISDIVIEHILHKRSHKFESLLNSLDIYTRKATLMAVDLLSKWIDKHLPMINTALIELDRLQKSIEKEKESLESFPEEETYPYQCSFFHKYEWCVGHNMSMGFIREAVSTASRSKNPGATLSRMVTEFYTQDNCYEIEQLVSPWKDSVVMANSRRMKIIKDCIQALRLRSRSFNPSNLIVPALVAQIDGCIHTYFVYLGFKYDKKKRCYISQNGEEKKREELLSETRYMVRLLERAMIPIEFIKRNEHDEKVSSLINKTLFRAAYTGIPLQKWESFNRHKILHGENVTYGRLDNVIRCFLILDYLCWLT